MNFGDALNSLKQGYKIAREGWNGKGMWLLLLIKPALPHGDEYEPHMTFPTYRVSVFHEDILSEWIGMKTSNDKFVPWLASQTDILAEDWVDDRPRCVICGVPTPSWSEACSEEHAKEFRDQMIPSIDEVKEVI